MYTREWTNRENELAKSLYEAGVDVRAIANELPKRTDHAVNRHALNMGWKRPEWYRIPRPNPTWEAIREVLATATAPMDVDDIAARIGVMSACVYKRLAERRGKLVRVTAWRETTRKPAAMWSLGGGIDAPKPVGRRYGHVNANPFAAAAGLVAAPAGGKGRIFIHLTDTQDEEIEEVA